MKELEIEKTKPTFIISVLKVDIMKVGLVFSISNFLANNWRRKKIPSCSNSALSKNLNANLKRLWAHGNYQQAFSDHQSMGKLGNEVSK